MCCGRLGMVTLVHEWLRHTEGGAERVLRVLLDMYPQGRLRAAYGNDSDYCDRSVSYSMLNRLYTDQLPFRIYRSLSPLAFLMSATIHDDVVISGGHSGSLWIRVEEAVPWIHYCHTPARFIWRPDLLRHDRCQMSRESLTGAALKRSDAARAQRPTLMLANSEATRRRIHESYGRDAPIVHPPVATDYFRRSPDEENHGYLLVVARLEHYRRIWPLLSALASSHYSVQVVGTGGALDDMRRQYSGPRVRFLGRVSDAELRRLYSEALALIVPGEEDFCMTAVESMSCGTPVIATRRGGVLETVISGETGVLVDTLTPGELIEACRFVDGHPWDREAIRQHSLRFSTEQFRIKIAGYVREVTSTGPPS